MKTIFKYITWFVTAASAVAIIWVMAAYFTTKDNDQVIVQDQLSIIIDTQEDQRIAIDSVCGKLDAIQRDVNNLSSEQKALRGSYVRYLTNDSALTKDDFIQYMQGLTFDFKKKETASELTALDETITSK